jgi:hypothetical protein
LFFEKKFSKCGTFLQTYRLDERTIKITTTGKGKKIKKKEWKSKIGSP